MSLLDAEGMDIFSGVMSVILAVVGATLCGGGGMALVSAGPAGMAAGAAVGILIAILGKSGMEKALRKAKLPILMRRVVTDNAVRRGLSRQREEIERAIIQALANPSSGFAARLCQSLSKRWACRWSRWRATRKCRFARERASLKTQSNRLPEGIQRNLLENLYLLHRKFLRSVL